MSVTNPDVTVQAGPMDGPPDPEIPARARRRTYTAAYKAQVLAEYDGADKTGKGSILRREGLYTSLIAAWREQRDTAALQGLGRAPGRAKADPLERENARLARENERLAADLTYLCSEASVYRLLRSRGEVHERRRQATHPARTKPELVATAPNQVWSWDITKLAGPVKWSYFHLYTIIDIYSRYIVGWMIAPRESAALAEEFLAETIRRHGIDRDELTIHSDNGSSMASRPVAFLLADLGVTKSHSRPHCSNDNPYSELAFKTLKYRPDFPARFCSLEHARAHGRKFFTWYNTEHRHSGIAMLTPADVHHGRVDEVLTRRRCTLAAAHAAHPERFTRPPQPPAPPSTAYINRPSMNSTNQATA